MWRRRWTLMALSAAIVAALGLGAVLAAPLGHSPQQSPEPQTTDKQEHGFLGVVLVKLNPKVAQRLGLTSTEGVAIAKVLPGGPAAVWGVQRGDIVLTVNGQAVQTPGDIKDQLRQLSSGDQVTLRVQRDVAELTLTVTLGETPVRTPHREPHGSPLGIQGLPRLLPRLIQGNLELMGPSSTTVTLTITPGSVVAASGTTLTIERKDGQSAQFTVPEGVAVLRKGRQVDVDTLEAGDLVVVIQKDGQVVRVISGAFARMGPAPQAPPRGHSRPPMLSPQHMESTPGRLRGIMGPQLHDIDARLGRLERRLEQHMHSGTPAQEQEKGSGV